MVGELSLNNGKDLQVSKSLVELIRKIILYFTFRESKDFIIGEEQHQVSNRFGK